MKKLLGLLMLAIMLALVPQSAQAARYGTGSITANNLTFPAQYGCLYHPYTVNLSLGYETTDWYLDVRITAPNGTLYDTGYASEWDTVGGSRTLTGEIFFCASQTTPGTYTITGVLNTYEGASDYTATPQNLTPAQFTVSPYVAPTPPPPPPPAPTPTPTPAPAPPATADVTGSVSGTKINNGIKLTFKSKALPAGTVVGKRLAWTVLVDSKIRKTFSQGPSAIRTLKFTSRDHSGSHKVKILRNGRALKTFYYRA